MPAKARQPTPAATNGRTRCRRSSGRFLQLAWSSKAALAMAPLQDVLNLGKEARMNRPGTTRGNWAWRLEPGQLTDADAARLRAAATAAGRAPR